MAHNTILKRAVLFPSLPLFTHIREIILVFGAYFTYMFVRKFIGANLDNIAIDNASKVVKFEVSVGFFWEPYWQDWAVESSKNLLVFLNWAYIFSFFPILLITSVILYIRDRQKYHYYRNVVLLSFILALIVFAIFPLAPPRFMPEYGFVDAIARYGPTWYASREAAVAVDNARIFESLRREQQRAKQLLNQVVAAQEDERQRVASELHDGVAQWLVNASYQMQVCMALMAQGKTQQLAKDMGEVETTLRSTLKELRQVLSGLRPPALEELGLTHAVIRDLERLEETGVSCSIQMEGSPMRMPLEAEIATYRVVQEGLNNIRKHAHAGEARVRLEFGDQELSIRIKDNGSGFNTAEALEGDPSIGHLGLVGMKHRVEGLGGTIQISSKVGLGTTIDIHLPIETDTIEEEATWMASA